MIKNFTLFSEKYLGKMYRSSGYRILLYIFGFFTFGILHIMSRLKARNPQRVNIQADIKFEYQKAGLVEKLTSEAFEGEKIKAKYLQRKTTENEMKQRSQKTAKRKFEQVFDEEKDKREKMAGLEKDDILSLYAKMIKKPVFFIYTLVFSFPIYLMIIIYSRPYVKYICERLLMMVFVLVGVVVLVFSILYVSPMDPAMNILGVDATVEKVAEFERIYGLDKPYFEQLIFTIKRFITFDFGTSFVGNENIMNAISRRFPISVQLAFASLFVSVAIAIPSGIISAVKQYSAFDYIFMLIALLGLSIPNFWLGLILILNFSINLGWLPAMYSADNLLTLIMPAIVLGTGLSATVARMTRSSMLEVKNQDYVLTARAKGLGEGRVIIRHILSNAMIPIVTVIGLQFGGLLGGSSVTEKVFNVNGLGKYIIEKQFIPDIPVVLAGVVYIAVIISMVNLLVDILYAFLDPRIKSKIKNY